MGKYNQLFCGVPSFRSFFRRKMLNLFNKIPIFEDNYVYQAPLTPEEEDEFVYNYLTEKRLGGEIQDGCKNESIYSRRFENSVIGMGNGASNPYLYIINLNHLKRNWYLKF